MYFIVNKLLGVVCLRVASSGGATPVSYSGGLKK